MGHRRAILRRSMVRALHPFSGQMADWQHHLLLKVVIATVVFPILSMAFWELWRPLLLLLSFTLPARAHWVNTLGTAIMIVGAVVAVSGAFAICRRMWPKVVVERGRDVSSREV